MGSKIPTIHFDTSAFPESERFARWATAVPAYDVSQPAGEGAFAALVDVWTLGEVVVTTGPMSAVRFARSAERARLDPLDRYSFLLVNEGRWSGDLGGPPVAVEAGELIVFDLLLPMILEGGAGDTTTVQVPRVTLESRLTRVPEVHGRVLNDPMGRLLADHFRALVRQLPHVEEEEGATVANATLGLIASCFDAQAKTVTSATLVRDKDTRLRIKDYIDRRLTMPDLSLARICDDLALSRPALYRAFASESGIAAYIRERRLATIHDLLTNPDERRTISAIAYEFGFASDAHFSRIFRERYGYTPSELRSHKAVMFRRLAEAVQKNSLVDTYLIWMKENQQ